MRNSLYGRRASSAGFLILLTLSISALSGSAPAAATNLCQQYNDNKLIPKGYETIAALPNNLPCYSVKDYGAKGDGVTNDTPAIRSALAAATATNGGIVFFPPGNYAVEPDPTTTPFKDPTIFKITTSNIVIMGAGKDKSTLTMWMPGHKDPEVFWYNNPDPKAYFKIGRAIKWRVISSKTNPVTNIQFRSIGMDGNAGHTGDYAVGGWQVDTVDNKGVLHKGGDGWDMNHKAIQLTGANMGNLLIFNADLHDFRGEVVHAGSAQKVYVINTRLTETNSSALSVSGEVTVYGSSIGSPTGRRVYNAVENQAIESADFTYIDRSNMYGKVVIIGFGESKFTLTNSLISAFTDYGVLLSEYGNNTLIKNNRFKTNRTGIITSVIGVTDFPTGFQNIILEGNTVEDSGTFLTLQNVVKNLKITGNTIVNGALIASSSDLSTRKRGTLGQQLISGNIFEADATDYTSSSGYPIAVWEKSIRKGTTAYSPNHNSKYWLNDFGKDDTPGYSTFRPGGDVTVLNSNASKGPHLVDLASAWLDVYPVGYTVTVYSTGKTNWFLKANANWNNFAADLNVPVTGIKLEVNDQGKFQIWQPRMTNVNGQYNFAGVNSKYWVNHFPNNANSIPGLNYFKVYENKMILNDNSTKGEHLVTLPTGTVYAAGTTITVYSTGRKQNWALKADSGWNTFKANVPVTDTNFGVKIRVNAQGKFELIP